MKRLLSSLAALLALALIGAVGGYALLRAPSLPVPEPRDHVFPGVTLVEPGAAPRPGWTLRTAQDRIVSVSPDASADVADEATHPELAGLVATPGLIDMHVHYPPWVALGNRELWSLLFLAHGVTSVRETGSVDGGIFSVRSAIASGRTPGPRIFACGRILDGSPPSFPSNRVVTTPEEARAAVRDEAGAGADCIKAYNMLRPPVLSAIVDEAARYGLPVIGHVPHAVGFEEAGMVDLQHGTGAVLVDRARVGRLDFRFEDWRTVDDARVAHVAAISRNAGIAHTPTLVNARMRELLLDPDARDRALARDTGLRHLPRFWVDVWGSLWGEPHRPGDAAGAAVTAHFRSRQAALTLGLHLGGARVHAGTDTLMPYVGPGSSLHGELADLVTAGLPVAAAWRAATRTAGETLGLPGLGTLAPGAPADLLFLRPGEPGAPPSPDRIEAVLAAGRLYHRRDLDAALARFDAHFHGRLYRGVVSTLTGWAKGAFAP